jgi:hypothetical protein
LGRAERMRVPSPAASTIARQLRTFIAISAALSYPSRPLIESGAAQLRPRCGPDATLAPARESEQSESARFLALIRLTALPGGDAAERRNGR